MLNEPKGFTMSFSKNIALIYDRLNTFGGAEQVLIAFGDVFPRLDLWSAVYAKKRTSWIPQSFHVKTGWLGKISWIQTRHSWFPWLMPIVFEDLDLQHYDLLISVTSEAAKGVIVPPSVPHICYLLTPTRYLWSHADHYQRALQKHLGFIWVLSKPVFRYLQRWDYVAAQRPSFMVAISKRVAERARLYYDREPDAIIYPPVDTVFFSREKASEISPLPRPYLLWVGRLVSYKGIRTVVDAMAEFPDLDLLIIGQGKDEHWLRNKIKQLSRSSQTRVNIHYLGFQSQEFIRDAMAHAKALIHPTEEDFGITMIEAAAMGTPVILHEKSGAAEILRKDEHAIYLTTSTVPEIVQAIQKLESFQPQENSLRQAALRCDRVKFVMRWKEFVCKTTDMC